MKTKARRLRLEVHVLPPIHWLTIRQIPTIGPLPKGGKKRLLVKIQEESTDNGMAQKVKAGDGTQRGDQEARNAAHIGMTQGARVSISIRTGKLLII